MSGIAWQNARARQSARSSSSKGTGHRKQQAPRKHQKHQETNQQGKAASSQQCTLPRKGTQHLYKPAPYPAKLRASSKTANRMAEHSNLWRHAAQVQQLRARAIVMGRRLANTLALRDN